MTSILKHQRCPNCGLFLRRYMKLADGSKEYQPSEGVCENCNESFQLPDEPSIEDRFWSFVDKKSDSECWPWNGYLNDRGYSRFAVGGGVSTHAYRYAYQLAKGPIPEGLTVDHLCRNRACVNPSHLEAVTQAVNTLRGNTVTGFNAKKTHCIHGHPFDEENTRDYFRNGRPCRACRACERNRELATKAAELQSSSEGKQRESGEK